VAPLHRRILGRGATEVDLIYDLRAELEKAYELDQMEYDTYLDCHEALDVREAKAKEALDKATGRYCKPPKVINVKRKMQYKPRRYKRWHIKLFCVLVFLIVWKIISFKP
jgi:hypothetical protein